jgi:hypothetical protein
MNRAFSARLSLLAINLGLTPQAGMSDAFGVDSPAPLASMAGTPLASMPGSPLASVPRGHVRFGNE